MDFDEPLRWWTSDTPSWRRLARSTCQPPLPNDASTQLPNLLVKDDQRSPFGGNESACSRSMTRAARRSSASFHGRPMIWKPIGMPVSPERPTGTVMAGQPLWSQRLRETQQRVAQLTGGGKVHAERRTYRQIEAAQTPVNLMQGCSPAPESPPSRALR